MTEIQCGCGHRFPADATTYYADQDLGDGERVGLYNCPSCRSTRSGPARETEGVDEEPAPLFV